MDLSYEKYTAKSLVVRGDKETYNAIITKLGGTWNSRLKKGGPGWLVPITNEHKIQKLLKTKEKEIKDEQLSDIVTNKKNHKFQKSYHRSSSEDEDEDENSNDIEYILNYYNNYTKSPGTADVSSDKDEDEDEDENENDNENED